MCGNIVMVMNVPVTRRDGRPKWMDSFKQDNGLACEEDWTTVIRNTDPHKSGKIC